MSREQLSENFYRDEFACKCGCGFDTVDTMLLTALQDARDRAGVPVTINSAARCLKHNRSPAVGSNDASQHPLGKAADITIEGHTPLLVGILLQCIPAFYSGGIGVYDTFTHGDVRNTGLARW